MRKYIYLLSVTLLMAGTARAQVGIGEPAPANKLSVKGGAAVGSTYSATASPADGAIISGQVGIGTSAPNSAAALDLTSTTQGVLYPRMNTTQRNAIASPAQGLMIFNTTSGCLEFFVGTLWQPVACGCTSPPSAPSSIVGTFTSLCYSSAYSYSVPDVNGASSYVWTVVGDNSAVITGQGGTTVSISFSNNSGATAINVQAINTCGTGVAATHMVSFTTVPSPTSTIGGLPLTVCPSAAGAVTLTAPSYSPTPTSYTWSLPTGITATGSTTSSTISVTVPSTGGQTYTVSVYGVNCIGTGAVTTGTITTIGAPTAPTGLSASSTGTAFTASWSASTSTGSVAGYYLDVSTSATFSSFVTGYNNKNVGNVLTSNVTGLTCGTAYYFRVRAYDACSPSQTSASSATYTVSATPHGKQAFLYTGATQTFTVPCNVTSISVKMWAGGGGGGYYGSGGAAGYVSGTYTTSAGTALTVTVGGGGSGTLGTTTYPGGGKGKADNNNFEPSGSGGGYTSLKNGATVIAVAGAGGGGGGYSDYFEGAGSNAALVPVGGPGGGTTGGNGTDGSTTAGAYGRGGTAAAGGAAGSAGTGGAAATAGASLAGGNGGGTYSATIFYSVFGGGGGAGYYGGGGGGGSKTTVTNCGGGGGGSSYTTGFTSGAVNTQATTTSITSTNYPPNTSDTDYINYGGTFGEGGDFTPSDGTPGLVVISW